QQLCETVVQVMAHARALPLDAADHLLLELDALGDVAQRDDDLVLAALHEARLEVADVAVERADVLPERHASRLEGGVPVLLVLASELRVEEIAHVPADELALRDGQERLRAGPRAYVEILAV